MTGRLQAGDPVSRVVVYDPKCAFDRVKSKGATPRETLIAALDRAGEPAEVSPGGEPDLKPKPASPGQATMRTDLDPS